MGNKQSMEMPPAIILCGGYGTRIRDVSELLPKPMVPVGPNPILWHIMKIYSAFGVDRFILCLGYKREHFINYFLDYHARVSDITVKLGKHRDITYHSSTEEENWEVTLADTGEDAMTGCRLFRASKYLKENDENFFFTYGDAVADINIDHLYRSHLKGQKQLTVTAVHPAGRFGEMSFKTNGIVHSFSEKPQTGEGYINGGFMAMKKTFISKYLKDDLNMSLEGIPIGKAVKDNEMTAYEHDGFWQCMDTQREYNLLNSMWYSGEAKWTKYW